MTAKFASGATFTPIADIRRGGIRSGFNGGYVPIDAVTPEQARRIAANNLSALGLYIELESEELTTDQIVQITLLAWKRYNESAQIMANGIKQIRERLSAGQYAEFLQHIPGFRI